MASVKAEKKQLFSDLYEVFYKFIIFIHFSPDFLVIWIHNHTLLL